MRRPQIIPQFSVGAPMVPTGLTATAVSSTQINLAWNASSDPGGPGLKDYGVYRQGTGLLGYVAGTSFNNTGLTSSTAYTYWVTARDLNLLESSPSGFASATTQGTGNLTHGQGFTATGFSGAGTDHGSMLVRDVGNATAGTIDSQWTGENDPNVSSGEASTYWIQNHAVGFSPTGATIGAPNPYVGNILSGCHNPIVGHSTGVNASVNFTPPTLPYAIYLKTRLRCDPNWVFNLGSPIDNNYKFLSFGQPAYVFFWDLTLHHDPTGVNSPTSAAQIVLDDGAAGPVLPDINSHGAFWGGALNHWNATNGWIEYEMKAIISTINAAPSSGGGQINLFENGGSTLINYQGRTDSMAGTTRSLGIGGYSRDYPSINNWRYFGDSYIRMGGTNSRDVACLVVGDAATYATCTVREPQVHDSWADGSIHVPAFWKGSLVGNTTGYMYACTEGGTIVPCGSRLIASSP